MGFRNTVLTTSIAVARVGAEVAPLPCCGLALDLVTNIVKLCEGVPNNRESARQLKDQSDLLRRILEKGTSKMPPNEALVNLENTLRAVEEKMQSIVKYSWFKAFVYSKETGIEIARCKVRIDSCLGVFHTDSSLKTTDRLSVMEDGIQQLLTMQNTLGETLPDSPAFDSLRSEIYDLQMECRALLPDLHLRRGEVQRLGRAPIGGTPSMDIWMGKYLGKEDVAIKILRVASVNKNSTRRFQREIKIWGDIWKKDRGRYILGFYGFCTTDGEFPYMVTPWLEYRTANQYLEHVSKNKISLNYPAFIERIAMGIEVLHSHDPPVVHGDLRGENIAVDINGQPFIADFGVSRLVEDLTGVPYTQSNGVTDALRWHAPELHSGPGVITTSADVYAFAMTVLELITHKKPFSDMKHTNDVTLKVAAGKRPKRPTQPEITSRGLDDKLWKLLYRCWSVKSTNRPTIKEVIVELPEVKPAIEVTAKLPT